MGAEICVELLYNHVHEFQKKIRSTHIFHRIHFIDFPFVL